MCFHINDMVFHMKTTLMIPDSIYRNLKRRAADRDTTISELVTEYLRQGLDHQPKLRKLPRLPSFSAGRPLIDVASRDEIYRVLDLDRLRVYKTLGRPKTKG